MSLKSLLYPLGLVILFATNCDLSPIEDDELYPASIPVIEMADLVELNKEYHAQNDGKICSTLNEYGLTGFSRTLFINDVNPCLDREEVKVEIYYSEELLNQAKEALTANERFTNVVNEEKLVLKESIPLNGCTICEGPNINNVPLQWRFSFENQIKDDIEVLDTEISVYLDANGVNRIWGNWFKIYSPDFIEVGYVYAQEVFLGKSITYQDTLGNLIQHKITKNNLGKTPYLKYVSIKKEEKMALHKCWIVELGVDSIGTVKWKGMVDVQSGEILKIEEI